MNSRAFLKGVFGFLQDVAVFLFLITIYGVGFALEAFAAACRSLDKKVKGRG